MKPIYLDNSSTTVVDPIVVEAMRNAFESRYANPASQHAEGRRSRAALEDAREAIGRLLGARVDEFRGDRLILTSGGTESNNLALRGIGADSGGQIVISAIEHPSVSRVAAQLKEAGEQVATLPVDKLGVVQLNELQRLIEQPTRLVSVMLGNNETGVIQPIHEIVSICEPRGIPVHTDATQAVGKIPVSFGDLGVAALTFAGHKFHGPRGIGGLLLQNSLAIEPLLLGGFQQAELRAGTENVELAIGLLRALELSCQKMDENRQHLAELRDDLQKRLSRGWPELAILSGSTSRLPHILAVAFPSLDRQALVMALDLAKIACSTGSACASGSSEPSPTLAAMQCSNDVISSAIRLSVSRMNTSEEMADAADRILSTCHSLRSAKSSQKRP